MNVIVDSLMTSYNLSGKGRLVLVLHGWGDAAKGLAGLQQTLARHYQVVALDLPGFGGTQMPKGAWDLDDYADFLQAFLKKLKLGQPYAVVGHSNGGALAIRAVSLGRLKPQKLVLLAASGIRTSQPFKRLIISILAKTGSLATVWMPERYRQALRKSLYSAAGSDLMVVPALEETFKKTVRQDVQQDAAKLALPTLLVYAANDEAVPLADGRRYNSLIKDSRLKTVEGAGHFVHLDEPERVGQLVGEFLK